MTYSYIQKTNITGQIEAGHTQISLTFKAPGGFNVVVDSGQPGKNVMLAMTNKCWNTLRMGAGESAHADPRPSQHNHQVELMLCLIGVSEDT